VAKKPESSGALLDRRLLHDGPDIKITLDRVRLPNDFVLELERIHHPGAAAILPFVDDETLLMVRQYRWAADSWLYEIPAGKLRPGEAPEDCAHRELVEETGFRAGRLEPLGWIWTTPGYADEKIHLFAARDLEPATQALEEDEVLAVERVPLERALRMAREGALVDAKSLCALLRIVIES
jgi:ADP-ribose pyrophosphatase